LNIAYVLLIGNPDPDDPIDPEDTIGDIPMKMLYPRVSNVYYWSYYESPSDYFYADLTGNWDLDGDGLFGEERSSDEPTTPDPQIDENTFSVRWIGKINVTDPTGMRITAYYDDGVRIWIDLSGEPVIDNWNDNLAGNGYNDILTPGMHDIKIEYYQNVGNAFFRLLKGPVGASWYDTINADQLYYWNGNTYEQGGLNGEYFNDENLTNFVFARIDPNDPSYDFDFQWFSGDRGEGGVDFSPEVCVGRIPVYNNDYFQLDQILSKLIVYENSSTTIWRNSVLLPMKPLDTNRPGYQLGEQIRTELCESNNFDYYRIYEEEYGCTPPPEMTPCNVTNVLTAWQHGYGIVTWETHGSADTARDVFNSSLCPELDDTKPSIVLQGSCNNGYPEDPENLGYALLKNGAVATVSASRVSWGSPSADYISPDNRYVPGFCYFYTQHIIENNTTGESLNFIKDISAISSNNWYWMNIFDFNLYGDPSIKLNPLTMTEKYKVRLRTQSYMGAVHINFDGGETFVPADLLYSLDYGSVIRLKAVSHDPVKYPFANWSGAVSSAENPLTVTVTTSMLIVANFEDTTPVELSLFTVQFAPRSVSRAVLLRWETASETNNFGFEVERTFGEDKNWQRIGFVNGAGTSSQQRQYQFIDDTAAESGTYSYRLKQVDTDGAFNYSPSVRFEVTAPLEYTLEQNYPNPFNPTTTIVFQVKEEGRVTLDIYDLLGRRVMTLVDGVLKAGTHRAAVDASELSPGIYFYRLSAGSFSKMKKMTLIK
jgi:hypothetical protein